MLEAAVLPVHKLDPHYREKYHKGVNAGSNLRNRNRRTWRASEIFKSYIDLSQSTKIAENRLL